MRLDEVSLGLRLERRTTNGSSSGRIMRLVLVFILETHNPDELPNHCPTSSRRMMRPQYKNGLSHIFLQFTIALHVSIG